MDESQLKRYYVVGALLGAFAFATSWAALGFSTDLVSMFIVVLLTLVFIIGFIAFGRAMVRRP